MAVLNWDSEYKSGPLRSAAIDPDVLLVIHPDGRIYPHEVAQNRDDGIVGLDKGLPLIRPHAAKKGYRPLVPDVVLSNGEKLSVQNVKDLERFYKADIKAGGRIQFPFEKLPTALKKLRDAARANTPKLTYDDVMGEPENLENEDKSETT